MFQKAEERDVFVQRGYISFEKDNKRGLNSSGGESNSSVRQLAIRKGIANCRTDL